MDLRDKKFTLILNASPDSDLLNHRAKVLNEAGYYTSSVRTVDEAARHAVSMNCALALICYSFAAGEKEALAERLHRLSPGIRVVCLEPQLDNSQGALISKVEQALEAVTTG